MTSLFFTLRAQQDLAVSWTSEIAFYQRSEEYITGTALRGALAAAWLADHGPDLRYFADIFEGPVFFEGANPQGFKIVPLSVRRCKYKPLPACQQCYKDDAEPAKQGQKADTCACGGSMEYSKGEMAGPYSGSSEELRDERVRTAIDPITGSSKEQALFSQQALNSGLIFEGRITQLDKLGDEARQTFITWLDNLRSIRLGRGKSVMGEAFFTVSPSDENAKPVLQPGRHILRCRTPLILLDDMGRNTTQIDVEFKRRGLHETEVVPGCEWVRPVTIGGWHTVSGLPKPSDHALVAGSTYVIDVPADEVTQLQKVLVDGLGYRRREGFGAVDLDPAPWAPPPVQESPSSTHVRSDFRVAVDKVFRTLQAEQGVTGIQAAWVNQVRDLLQALTRGTQISNGAIAETKERPFWTERTRSVIDAREEMIRTIPTEDYARKALNYLYNEYGIDEQGGE